MTNIPSYIIISAPNLNILQTTVNDKISEGYTPIGGMVAESNHTPYQSQTIYFQTLFLNEKTTKRKI